MRGFGAALALLALGVSLVAAAYALSHLVRVALPAREAGPSLAGNEAGEHAFSRYHVRWYPLAMIYLAFEMEMLFMYPWTLIVSTVGVTAVIEMFLFLGVLLAGVAYAWREGALRWT